MEKAIKLFPSLKPQQITAQIKLNLLKNAKEKVNKKSKLIVKAYYKIQLKQILEKWIKRLGGKIKSSENEQKNLPNKIFKSNKFQIGKVHMINKKIGSLDLLRNPKTQIFIEKEVPQKFFTFDASKFKFGDTFKVKSHGYYVKKPKNALFQFKAKNFKFGKTYTVKKDKKISITYKMPKAHGFESHKLKSKNKLFF